MSENHSNQTSSGGTCRACMLFDDASRMIFLFQSNNNLAEIFSKCTSLETIEMDGLPKHICFNCHNDLVNYNKFRLLCNASDSYFREKLNVKQEHVIEELNEQQLVTEDDEITEEFEEHLRTDLEDCEFNEETSEETKESFSEENIIELTNSNSNDSDDKDVSVTSELNENSNGDQGVESQTLNKQTKLQSKLTLSCDQCGKKFFKSHRLEGHLRQHEGLKQAVCKLCGKAFAKWSGLSLHMSGWHNDKPDKKQFTCDVKNCNKAYNMKQSLCLHKKICHSDATSVQEIKCICEVCGKSFKTSNALKKHTYTHTGYDSFPYCCTVCPKKYTTKHKLKEHTMRHEGIKNHICPFCGLRKTTPHELKVHINYHTREKLYPCKLCSAVFSSIGNMRRHFKIVHCGIKAYNCTICDRSFGKAETLKHHVFTHTGEKPHSCGICNKRFIQSIALQTHMKTHKKVT